MEDVNAAPWGPGSGSNTANGLDEGKENEVNGTLTVKCSGQSGPASLPLLWGEARPTAPLDTAGCTRKGVLEPGGQR